MIARIKKAPVLPPFTWQDGSVDLENFATYALYNNDVPAGVTVLVFNRPKGGLDIEGIADLESFSAPNLVSCAGDNYIEIGGMANPLPALTVIAMPKLATPARLILHHNPLLVDVDLASLSAVAWGLDIYSNAVLPALDLSALVTVYDHVMVYDNPSLTSILLPALESLTGNYLVGGGRFEVQNNNLTSLLLPEMTQVGKNFWIHGNANLVTLSIPQLLFLPATSFNGSGCALNAASVNSVLARAVASGITTGTFNLTGGTNAAPTGQGITDKAALITAGVTVTTN